MCLPQAPSLYSWGAGREQRAMCLPHDPGPPLKQGELRRCLCSHISKDLGEPTRRAAPCLLLAVEAEACLSSSSRLGDSTEIRPGLRKCLRLCDSLSFQVSGRPSTQRRRGPNPQSRAHTVKDWKLLLGGSTDVWGGGQQRQQSIARDWPSVPSCAGG